MNAPRIRLAVGLLAVAALVAGCATDTQPTAVSRTTPASGVPTTAPATTTTTAAPTTTTTAGPAKQGAQLGLDALTVAIELVRRASPDGTKDDAICLGNRFERQPELIEPAKKPLDQLDLATRKQVLRALADCGGIDVLVAQYAAGHPGDLGRPGCIEKLLSARSLSDAVAVAAGDPDLNAAFDSARANSCQPAADSTTTAKPPA